ncbi:MAG TPA: hypothetical protein VF178_01520, partial [Gemmatimonadaceae bacterium]
RNGLLFCPSLLGRWALALAPLGPRTHFATHRDGCLAVCIPCRAGLLRGHAGTSPTASFTTFTTDCRHMGTIPAHHLTTLPPSFPGFV